MFSIDNSKSFTFCFIRIIVLIKITPHSFQVCSSNFSFQHLQCFTAIGNFSMDILRRSISIQNVYINMFDFVVVIVVVVVFCVFLVILLLSFFLTKMSFRKKVIYIAT